MNTTTKHTPGPWEVTVQSDDSNFTTYMINEEDTAGAEYGEEAEANARLIGAAPELLDFAYMAEKFLRSDMSNAENIRAFKDMANAAIAKAEGK